MLAVCRIGDTFFFHEAMIDPSIGVNGELTVNRAVEIDLGISCAR
jgi:hypothetical protein